MTIGVPAHAFGSGKDDVILPDEILEQDKKTDAAAISAVPPPGDLLRMCESREANCTFKMKSHVPAPTVSKVVGLPVLNCSETNNSPGQVFTWEETTGYSNSLGVTIDGRVEIAKIFQLGLSTSYEHTWQWSKTVRDSLKADVSALHVGWSTLHVPMEKVTGQFDVNPDKGFHRSRGDLQVPFEVTAPNPDQVPFGVYDERPMTPEEIARHCSGPGPTVRRRSL